jgi:hypothetical protein
LAPDYCWDDSKKWARVNPLTECTDEDPRANFRFSMKGEEYVIPIRPTRFPKNLGFGDLLVLLMSPLGTCSELKIFIEWSKLNTKIEQLDLIRHQSWGESFSGDETASAAQHDTADSGVIVSGTFTPYDTITRPSVAFIDQENRRDPFRPKMTILQN